jgi:hypothetical protein
VAPFSFEVKYSAGAHPASDLNREKSICPHYNDNKHKTERRENLENGTEIENR